MILWLEAAEMDWCTSYWYFLLLENQKVRGTNYYIRAFTQNTKKKSIKQIHKSISTIIFMAQTECETPANNFPH